MEEALEPVAIMQSSNSIICVLYFVEIDSWLVELNCVVPCIMLTFRALAS